MKYENQTCVVCNELFNSDDDIVVCPECGTPHHRDCYFSNGGCKNEALHKDGFTYKFTVNNSENSAENENKLDILIEDEVKKTPVSNELINIEYADENAENKENFQQTIEELFKNINGKTTDQILINNIPSSYFEAAIGKNQNYYMPRFLIIEKTNKKFLLNVCAFIFPMAWAVYRKMYKLALLVLALYIALTAAITYPVFTSQEIIDATAVCVEEDPECFNQLSLYMMGENVTLTKNQTDLINAINEATPSNIVVYATMFISMAMKIYIGLTATRHYKNKLYKDIKNAQQLLPDDGSIKQFLSSKYGVTSMVIAYIIGFIEYFVFRYF